MIKHLSFTNLCRLVVRCFATQVRCQKIANTDIQPVRQQLSESDSDEGVANACLVSLLSKHRTSSATRTRADTGEGVGTIAISVTEDDGFLIEAVNAIDSESAQRLRVRCSS